jgi:TPR repeat protein
LAAEQGDDDAQFMLGLAYVLGEGVTKNILEGERWIRMAADQGNTKAQEYFQ